MQPMGLSPVNSTELSVLGHLFTHKFHHPSQTPNTTIHAVRTSNWILVYWAYLWTWVFIVRKQELQELQDIVDISKWVDYLN